VFKIVNKYMCLNINKSRVCSTNLLTVNGNFYKICLANLHRYVWTYRKTERASI